MTLPRLPAGRWLDLPAAAVALAVALGAVAFAASAAIAISPFDAALFGGLTVPTVLGAGVLDGLNPCAFALLVLFATYTLTLVNSVTSDGSPTALARRRLLGAGSLYVARCGSPTSSSAWASSRSSAGWARITSSPASRPSWRW